MIYNHCQILAIQKEILQRRRKIKDNISAGRFRVTYNKVYTKTQKFDSRCEELGDNKFYCLTCAHLKNFTPNFKIIGNMRIIANTDIFVGRKILPPEFVPPPSKILPLQKCPNSSDLCKFLVFGKY